jgi:hypothetical protein
LDLLKKGENRGKFTEFLVQKSDSPPSNHFTKEDGDRYLEERTSIYYCTGWSEQCQQDQSKWPWARQQLRRNLLLTSLQISGTPGNVGGRQKMVHTATKVRNIRQGHIVAITDVCVPEGSRGPSFPFHGPQILHSKKNLWSVHAKGQTIFTFLRQIYFIMSYVRKHHILWSLVLHDKLVGCIERLAVLTLKEQV